MWRKAVRPQPGETRLSESALEATPEIDALKALVANTRVSEQQRRWLERRCNGTGIAYLPGWMVSYRDYMHPYWVRFIPSGLFAYVGR